MLRYTEGDLKIDGVKIHYYRTGGQKPPFVMVHGATDNGLCWSPVAEYFSDRFDVIMPDAQGHGKSDRVTKACTNKVQAEQVAEMIKQLKDTDDIFIYDTSNEQQNPPKEDIFVDNVLQSYLTLCPRGSGINSYRFFESMQLSTVPIYIGNKDCRPFRDAIKWDEISFKCETVDELVKLLTNLRSQKDMLLEMGKKAKTIFDNELDFQKWEKYVIEILKTKMMWVIFRLSKLNLKPQRNYVLNW